MTPRYARNILVCEMVVGTYIKQQRLARLALWPTVRHAPTRDRVDTPSPPFTARDPLPSRHLRSSYNERSASRASRSDGDGRRSRGDVSDEERRSAGWVWQPDQVCAADRGAVNESTNTFRRGKLGDD
jgi:hypothetical protein